MLILGVLYHLYKKYYTNIISAWGAKAGLLIYRLLHQDQRNKVLKKGITFGLCGCSNCQTKVESLIENFENIDIVLFIKLIELRKSPSPVLVEEIRKLDTFKDIMQHIVSTMGTESQMNMTYLKNVPTMLAIVSAVRESHLKRHFSAEQKILKLMFAFDHINYAR